MEPLNAIAYEAQTLGTIRNTMPQRIETGVFPAYTIALLVGRNGPNQQVAPQQFTESWDAGRGKA